MTKDAIYEILGPVYALSQLGKTCMSNITKEQLAVTQVQINDEHYLQVHVWKDLASFQAYFKAEPTNTARYIGLKYYAHPEDRTREPEQPKVGEIHIVYNITETRHITHELQHFMLDWQRMWRIDVLKDEEFDEQLCSIAGDMAQKITDWYLKVKRYCDGR